MPGRNLGIFGIVLFVLHGESIIAQEPADPYKWLESIDGVKSLGWLREHNDATLAELKQQRRMMNNIRGELYEYSYRNGTCATRYTIAIKNHLFL